MENKIKEILNKLYLIDSSLKEKEFELEKIILKMLEIKPNIKVNKEFKNSLKQELNKNVTEIKMQNYSKNGKITFIQIFAYVFGTAGIACFGFIIFRENIISTTKTEIPTNIESFGLIMDQNEPLGGISNLKASPMISEYIQEVYHFSFSGELNIDFSGDFPTFKKEFGNNMYFSKQDLELEKSIENILKVTLKGGKDGFGEMPESQKKKDVYINLKNPKLRYTNVYTYSNGESKEYFVPCIIFEIDKTGDTNNYYQNEVIVPLVKEIYKYDENGTIIGVSQ